MSFEGRIIKLRKNDAAPISWSIKSKLAIGRANGSIEILQPDGELTGIGKQSQQISAIAWNLEGTILAVAARDNVITLWEDDSKIASLKSHKRPIYQMAWSPHSEILASCSGDKSVILWMDAEKLADLVGHNRSCHL